MPDTKPLTGYPSVDEPWLNYYSEEAINAPLIERSFVGILTVFEPVSRWWASYGSPTICQ